MIDKIIEIGQAMGKSLGKLMYPEVCPLCGELLDNSNNAQAIENIGGKYVCNSCRIKLNPIKAPVCLKCGKEIDDEEMDCCSDCAHMVRSFKKGFPAIKYNSHMSKCLSDFKYHNMRSYGTFLADIIVRQRGKEILMAGPEVIVPVPVHKSKLKDRGYNQAEVLGKELEKRLKIPVDTGLILRGVKTTPQKGLSNMQREENLKKAFISSGKIVEYKSALIVDDIYTTGATVEACTGVLLSMGIENVYYTSVCIGDGL